MTPPPRELLQRRVVLFTGVRLLVKVAVEQRHGFRRRLGRRRHDERLVHRGLVVLVAQCTRQRDLVEKRLRRALDERMGLTRDPLRRGRARCRYRELEQVKHLTQIVDLLSGLLRVVAEQLLHLRRRRAYESRGRASRGLRTRRCGGIGSVLATSGYRAAVLSRTEHLARSLLI